MTTISMAVGKNVEEKLREIRDVEVLLGNLYRELGETVAEGAGVRGGKMPVSGPAPVVADNGAAAHDESDDEVSIPKRFIAFLNKHPEQSFTAAEVITGIGPIKASPKTVYTLLRRNAKNGKLRKAGRGKFRANPPKKGARA
jgi:hypothetical protein